MESPPQRTLHGAVQGESVRLLQRALRGAGYEPGREDGVYGPETAAAVRRFQQAEGLPADGIVGPQTWQALARTEGGAGEALRKAPLEGTLHGATGGEDVRRAQEALAAAGFPPGDLDGVYGYFTARAVQRFQSARGLRANGIVGPETWAALLASPPAPTKGRLTAVTFSARPDRERIVALLDLIGIGVDFEEAELGAPVRRDKLEASDGILVFVSDALLEHVDDDGLLLAQEVARSGTTPLVPILVEPTSWSHTPLSEFRAAAGGRPLIELDELDALAGEIVTVLLREPPSAALLPRSYLPGYAADSTRGVDLLGVQGRVDFLASVLAAKQLETPLAVGLFGDWGSGKSFFMRRIQEQVTRLSEHSAQAEQNGEPSYYCSHVRQVSFNAWLYSDSDIWPSLATRVFRSVAGDETDVPHSERQTQDLREYQAGLREAAARRQEAEREEAAYGERIDELSAEIARKHAAIAERGAALGGAGGDAARSLSAAQELGLRVVRIVRGWRQLRPADLLLLLAPLAIALVVYLAGLELVAALVAVVSPLVPTIVKVIRYVDDTTQLQRDANELTARRDALAEKRDERARLRSEQEGLLESARTVPLLPEYAAEQALRWAGRERLGVVTEIRLAFEYLSRLIDESRAARAAGDVSPRDHLPVDRMIVYVDDLDRCSHDVVVRVLESIKVLLDLPHFAVVVGVDSRWLFRSIQVHFADVLRTDGSGRMDDDLAVTPQNYLEKIFQYSLVLRPLDAPGFGRLIESLLTVEDVAEAAAEAPRPIGVPPVEEHDGARPPEAGAAPAPIAPASAEPAARAASAAVDLTPGDLVITRSELEFMKGLAPLYETPRAAKRLANVYRLLRVSVGADELKEAESYEPVLVLLSVAIAFPALAGDLLRALARTTASRWDDFVAGLHAAPDSDAVEAAAWRRLASALERIDHDEIDKRPLSEFARWIEVVADFSFHPWQELLPAETRG
jgi:peptidoglycan hydrolase-like protein with peptidoglycan-binding domain